MRAKIRQMRVSRQGGQGTRARTRTQTLLSLLAACVLINAFGVCVCVSGQELSAQIVVVEDEGGEPHGKYAQHEHRDNLTSLLLRDFNSLVPGSDAVAVEFGLSVAFIVEVDGQFEIFTTNLQYNMKWQDPRLSWNSTEFGGIERVAFPPHRIWKPSIFLRNSADSQFGDTYPTPISITHDGHTSYNPPGIMRSSCPMDPTYFPFDHQVCHLRMGLMADEGYRVAINPPESDTDLFLRGYNRHSQWDIVNISIAKSSDSPVSPFKNEYDSNDLTFTFTLRRRPLFYVWTIVVPVLFVSYALPLLLLIPMQSRERLICTFLLFELLPELLRYFVPPQVTSAGITLVGKYAVIVNALGFIILVESVLQAAFCRGRRDSHSHVHVQGQGSNSSGKALIRGEDGRNLNLNHSDQERELLSGSRPSAWDVILMLACYAILTSWNLYTFFTLPWFYDARPHF